MAVHGYWCSSRIWPTRCLTCRSEVWYFSCACGSRVFFDHRGPPWPLHDCNTSWLRDIVRIIEPDGSIRVDLSENVSAVRPGTFETQAEITKPSRTRVRFVRMEPVEPFEVMEVSGILHEITQGSSLRKQFRLSDTAMAGAFLRSLGPNWDGPLGRINIHAPTSSVRRWEKYIAMIPASSVSDYRPLRGSQIFAILSSIGISDTRVWMCSYLSID